MADNTEKRIKRLTARLQRIEELLTRDTTTDERKASLVEESEERELELAFLEKKLKRQRA